MPKPIDGKQLVEEEAQFQLLKTIDAVGCVVAGADGIIIIANRRAEEMLQYAPDELIGKSIECLIPDHCRENHKKERLSFNSNPSARPMGHGRELWARRRDSAVFPVEIGLSPMTLNRKRYVACFIVDITRRKELERMRDELLALASHEIKSPITTILASLSSLKNSINQKLAQHELISLDIAYRECGRLNRMVRSYLDLERIAGGVEEFDIRTVPVMPAVLSAIESIQAQYPDGSIRFEIVDRAENLNAHVDQDRLQQALTNLLSNAAKFSPVGSVVTISVMNCDRMMRIAVADKGPGISEDFRAKIFQRFTQDRRTTSSTKDKGTGLGLSIVKAIAERMRGGVGFESPLGGGALFYIDVPM